jgi:hypothetical protein
MINSNNFEDLSPLQKLRFLKKHDSGDNETRAIIKLIEKILHNELETMLNEIRTNIKAGIFMSENNAEFIYFAQDVEKYFSHKLIEVTGHEN